MKNLTKKLTKAFGLVALTVLSGVVTAQNMKWSPVGPVYSAGRARNMVVDKNDASGSTIYLGSTTSGIFKTVNSGARWFPVNDSGAVSNISYLAQSQNGTIYAGTGEGFLRGSQRTNAEPGTGLYKLNSNNSLQLVVSSNVVGTIINRVACSPVNANVIALATNKGIMISTDGSNFAPAPGITITTPSLTSGLDVKFDNQGILYCSIGSERADGAGTYSTVSSKIWKSSDASLSSFSDITPTHSSLSDANYGRIELAIAPSNNNVIYASCAKKYSEGNSNFKGGLQGLFVSYDAGATWGLVLQGSSQLDPLSTSGTPLGGQFPVIGLDGVYSSGDYAHVITVHPTNPDILYVGAYWAYMYKRTGGTNASPIGTWTEIGSSILKEFPIYIHEEIHDIKITGSGNTTKFYFLTDAGVYRSIDLINASAVSFPSYQPFYKGLATGQFNSVSIQRFPNAVKDSLSHPGYYVMAPVSGFVGGTNGNGLNYYSGTDTLVSQETNYSSGVVYNAEFSKTLPDVVFYDDGKKLYRTPNIKNTLPSRVYVKAYQGDIANFSNVAAYPFEITSGYEAIGVPFRLWEYYGQTPTNPDSAIFYNDTLRVATSVSGGGVASLTTQTTFNMEIKRPNNSAMIDSIVIRTGTVTVGIKGFENCPTPFTGSDKKDVAIKLINPSYTGTTVPSTSVTSNVPISATGVTLNATSHIDKVAITYSAPPFVNKTIAQYTTTGSGSSSIAVSDPSIYYRVFATVFYKYKKGDSVYVTDNNITNNTATYGTKLDTTLSWAYGSISGISQVIQYSTSATAVVSNPTYVLNPGNVSQSTPAFTVTSAGTYTISQFGTYNFSATPVASFTLAAETPTTAATTGSPSYVISDNTGTIAVQASNVFTINPAIAADYTITGVDDDSAPTETVETYVTIEAPVYTALPDNITQASPDFTLTATAPTVYTLQGLSSYSVSSTSSTSPQVFTLTSVASYSTNPPAIRTVAANSVIPRPKNNPVIKIPMNGPSARLATVYNQTEITNSEFAVIISKNPLDMTKPDMEVIRVSANGCLTTKADGSPDNVNTVTVEGKPTILEWSNSGTELYYATDANKLYRVSYINMIMDMSSASYFGKLNTDVFSYVNGKFDKTKPNLNSPYRTTLIGSFTKPITSISVSNDDKNLVVTFNDPSGSVVMTNAVDTRSANISNIGWTSKTGTLTSANIRTYCSLIEKNNKNMVYIGTDKGLFYTNDISDATPTWRNAKDDASPMPNVQVFDIEQQVLEHYQCYNSGIIYVATNGRGIWQNKAGYKEHFVGISEFEKIQAPNNLSIYPNPTNGNVTIAFNSNDNETAVLNVMDINGRVVKYQDLGKVNTGEVTYSFDVAELPAGVYIVSVNSNANVKRVTKLIVTK